MDRSISVSELRRRPWQIIREAQDSAGGTTITYRGTPVAVLRGWIARREHAPDLERGPGSEDAGTDHGALGEALDLGGGWLAGNTDPQAPDVDAVLDSASWGLWEGLSDAERRALMRVIQEQRSGTDGEAACQSRPGEEPEDGDESTA